MSHSVRAIVVILMLWAGCRKLQPVDPATVAATTTGVATPLESTTSTDLGCGAHCGDCRMWLLGGGNAEATAENSVLSSYDGVTWTQEGSLPGARIGGAAIVFNHKLWYIGGSMQTNVWSSPDGVTWTTMGTLPTGLSPLNAAARLNNTIFLMGGGASSAPIKAYFSSTDGVTWTGGNMNLTVDRLVAGVLLGQLWTWGGNSGATTVLDSAQTSSTGATWKTTTSALPLALQSAATATWNSKVWIAGGDSGTTFQSGVLSTSTGTTWTTAGSLPAARMAGSMAAYNSKLWYVGGIDASSNPTATVWSTTDGTTWNSTGALSDARAGAALVTYSPLCGAGAQ